MNNLLKSNIAFVMNTQKDITKFKVNRMYNDMLMYVEYDQLRYNDVVVEADLIDSCGNTHARLVMLTCHQYDVNGNQYALDINKNYIYTHQFSNNFDTFIHYMFEFFKFSEIDDTTKHLDFIHYFYTLTLEIMDSDIYTTEIKLDDEYATDILIEFCNYIN